MKWINGDKEIPTECNEIYYLKIKNEKNFIKTIGFYNCHTKEFITLTGYKYKKKKVKWLRE